MEHDDNEHDNENAWNCVKLCESLTWCHITLNFLLWLDPEPSGIHVKVQILFDVLWHWSRWKLRKSNMMSDKLWTFSSGLIWVETVELLKPDGGVKVFGPKHNWIQTKVKEIDSTRRDKKEKQKLWTETQGLENNSAFVAQPSHWIIKEYVTCSILLFVKYQALRGPSGHRTLMYAGPAALRGLRLWEECSNSANL